MGGNIQFTCGKSSYTIPIFSEIGKGYYGKKNRTSVHAKNTVSGIVNSLGTPDLEIKDFDGAVRYSKINLHEFGKKFYSRLFGLKQYNIRDDAYLIINQPSIDKHEKDEPFCIIASCKSKKMTSELKFFLPNFYEIDNPETGSVYGKMIQEGIPLWFPDLHVKLFGKKPAYSSDYYLQIKSSYKFKNLRYLKINNSKLTEFDRPVSQYLIGNYGYDKNIVNLYLLAWNAIYQKSLAKMNRIDGDILLNTSSKPCE